MGGPSLTDQVREQQEAEAAVGAARRDPEAAAQRTSVPRGYDVPGELPAPLSVTYDAAAQTAAIAIGPLRPLRPQVTRLDRGITGRYDTGGRLAVIEITGVAEPEVRGSGTGG